MLRPLRPNETVEAKHGNGGRDKAFEAVLRPLRPDEAERGREAGIRPLRLGYSRLRPG